MSNQSQAQQADATDNRAIKLPCYRCHKKVEAAKIIRVWRYTDPKEGTIESEDMHGEPVKFAVSREYLDKHKPHPGGYYIRYEDGYESFSPKEAFESGYQRIGGSEAFTIPLETAERIDAAAAALQTVCREAGLPSDIVLGNICLDARSLTDEIRKEMAAKSHRLGYYSGVSSIMGKVQKRLEEAIMNTAMDAGAEYRIIEQKFKEGDK